MPAINIVDRYLAVQYDGTNSAEIESLITNLDILSEVGGVLTVESPPGSSVFVINTGDWVRYTQGMIISVHSTSAFDNFFIRNAVYDEVVALQEAVEELETGTDAGVRSVGVREAPLLIVGNNTVAVDIIPAMPDSSYTPQAQLIAAAGPLGSLSITNIAVVDANTVNVTVANSGLISLSGVRVLVVVKD